MVLFMKKNIFKSIALILSIVLLFASCNAGPPQNKDSAPHDTAEYPHEADEYWDTEAPNQEQYHNITENLDTLTSEETTATLSLKVDTASYSNIARMIKDDYHPPVDAVRTEELINYFGYEGETEKTDGPFYMYTEIGESPFDENKHMAFIRIKTPDIVKSDMPYNNLTFLIDTSGSMDSYDKLPLLKSAFRLLVDTLDENDRVSIVTYAGSSEVVLDSVSAYDKERILNAIDTLSAGGSTAGADGIQTAYELAAKNFKKNGNNRVILASDGDFNVGISDTNELKRFIADKRDSGVYLSVLGFGTGNLRDDMMETLSKHGNGNYSYIDTIRTAEKVLVTEMGANLLTVADDVKTQVIFNDDIVKSYRLIGYENRRLRNEDFDNDKKDAGEIGAGSDVVVLFELALYDETAGNTDEIFDISIRYKEPGESESKLINKSVTGERIVENTSVDYNFACSVAIFGHLLRDSENIGDATFNTAFSLAENNLGADKYGYRSEYLNLLKEYRQLR